MRQSNPALSESTFERFTQNGIFGGPNAQNRDDLMTVEGTVNKTLILLFLAAISAGWSWKYALDPMMADTVWPIVLVSMLVGLVVGLVTCFKPAWARFLAPAYAVLEGIVLGALSVIVNQRYPGIASQAIGLTFAVLGVMLVAYRTGLIRVTDKFRMVVVCATGAIFLYGLVAWAFMLFGHDSAWSARYSFENHSPLAIGISLIVVGIAALNLTLDFDFIERGAQFGAPKYMEWYGAFGLMVTLIWLYINLLRLLARLNSLRR
jgi:uncharacterized YccA/Bax inhibitor family protein